MRTLPKDVIKYFWGDNLADLSWKKHQKYIITTLLERGDKKAVAWLLRKVGKNKIKRSLSSLKLTPKSVNFWKLILKT
jgi:hypothetical protein